jgi:DNA-binding MarR family transcriptional regulator
MTKTNRSEITMTDDVIDAALALDNQLCFMMYTASRMLTRAYRPLLEELELTYPQYLVMLVLWEHDRGPSASDDPLTVKQLGQTLYLDSGTLTPLLKRLEQTGYIERVRSTDDERVVHAQLTRRGKALRRRAADVPVNLFCQVGQSPQELTDLRGQLKRVVDALET